MHLLDDSLVSLTMEGREIVLNKGFVHPKFGAKNVLTNSPWRYVDLWLRKEEKASALFYWKQAEQFHNASQGLSAEAVPLLLYYSFMNAAKALLSAKGISFSPHHGVSRDNSRPAARGFLTNEWLRIAQSGVLPSLANYYGEIETARSYNLKEIFANLAFIHRTYALTFTSQPETFYSLADCRYVFDTNKDSVYLYALPEKQETKAKARNNLPQSLTIVDQKQNFYIRSVSSIPWKNPRKATAGELRALAILHKSLRRDLQYNNGYYTLWYAKLKVPNSRPTRRIQRSVPTLTLAASHRLSEICRYNPQQLSTYLEGSQNWLLSEFIAMASPQFIDEIASEITGFQFFTPNVRAPSEPDVDS